MYLQLKPITDRNKKEAVPFLPAIVSADDSTISLLIYKTKEPFGVITFSIIDRSCHIDYLSINTPDIFKKYGLPLWRLFHDYCYDKVDTIIINSDGINDNFWISLGFKLGENHELVYTLNNWFTVESIDEETFCISEMKHANPTHSYLLLGQRRALLIDTGMGVRNIKSIVDKLTFFNLDVCLCDANWYRIGSVEAFDSVYIGSEAKEWLCVYPIAIEEIRKMISDENYSFVGDFDLTKYHVPHKVDAKTLHDGKTFNLGKRIIRAIHTPGTSLGHYSFYDEKNGYLFAGDLCKQGLIDISTRFSNIINYEDSIVKCSALVINKVFPSTGAYPLDPQIILEIKKAISNLRETNSYKQKSGLHHFEKFEISI